jgi:TetR/AcrR family transcriptional regulator, ethionamide resistance regulator
MARRPRSTASRARADQRDVREAVLSATESLLTERRFADLAVADILATAAISRASFYFYFESKHAVLAELAQRAVGEGHHAAQPWLTRNAEQDPVETLRAGIAEGAHVWRRHAPVLRAVVENWRDDAELSSLWVTLMNSYTDAAVARLEQDRRARPERKDAADVRQLVSALTWMSERLYYLAAIGVAPFDDEDVLVDALLRVWTATLYGSPQS